MEKESFNLYLRVLVEFVALGTPFRPSLPVHIVVSPTPLPGIDQEFMCTADLLDAYKMYRIQLLLLSPPWFPTTLSSCPFILTTKHCVTNQLTRLLHSCLWAVLPVVL